VIASRRNWVSHDAVQQLAAVAALPGVLSVAGMPDLHPGRGIPVGMVAATGNMVYPHLAGNDIGCGMGLWNCRGGNLKPNLDRWARKLKGLESAWDGDVAGWLAAAGVPATSHDEHLGTIGGGNHFAELQVVKEVRDESILRESGLAENALLLLVHSGSRGLGQAVLEAHLRQHGAAGLAHETPEVRDYLARHDLAVAWARANRALIASRFLSLLGLSGTPVLDLCHNSITRGALGDAPVWLHRKGAAPSGAALVVVPGSRGTATFLCKPVGDQQANLWSLAHGAGRKWARGDARARLEGRCSPESLKRTRLGSRVICEDQDLLYEEAPQSYKDIEVVVQDMVDAGLILVAAVLHPLITYKTRAGVRGRR
jgi:release factor H-coupled RctB family protein